MFEGYGTCCPSCGTRQAHRHLGWLKLREVLLTQVNCKKCGHISIIVRFVKNQNDVLYKELNDAIWEVFLKKGARI